jgi:hypothetical protein
LAEDAELLIKRLAVWDKFGQAGWGEDGSNAIFRGTKDADHSFGADVQAVKYFRDPKLVERVKKLMSKDLGL